MNTDSRHAAVPLAPEPAHGSPPGSAVPVLTAVAVIVASGVATATGPGAEYAQIFPPAWLGIPGAAAVLFGVLLRARALRTGRTTSAEAAAWAGAVLLIGASGGFVLDCFRAFFAVTGIPAGAFSEVDVPGAVARGLSLAGAFIAIRLARTIRADAGREFRATGSATGRLSLLAAGLVLCVPYPLLKTIWWMQGDDGGFDVGFPAMELVLFAVAAAGVVVLTTTLGDVLPRWLVVLGGWGGSLVLMSMGALMVVGLVAQATHLVPATVDLGGGTRAVIVFAVYSTWLLLGAAVAAATVLYEERRASVAPVV